MTKSDKMMLNYGNERLCSIFYDKVRRLLSIGHRFVLICILWQVVIALRDEEKARTHLISAKCEK